MPENCDLTSSQTLTYGTGWAYTGFNKYKGDVLDYEKDGTVVMQGDFELRVPSVWDVWMDPQAKCWDDVRYVIERRSYPMEEAEAMYPKYISELHRAYKREVENESYQTERNRLEEPMVTIFYYWEKGHPMNGMRGRYVAFIEDGTPLGEMTASPAMMIPDVSREEKKKAKAEGRAPKPGFGVAVLPFHIFTDIDVPNQVYGKSFIEYEADVQDVMNRLDSLELENIQYHGSIKLVVREGSDLDPDSLNNSAVDVIKLNGGQDPYYMSAPTQMPNVTTFRDRLKQGGDDMAGTNESMFGQQSREQSGFSMQYATNQGNMIRRRLFNKYVMFVEGIYKQYLNVIRGHWDVSRVIKVLGTERAFEAVEIKGADIAGGYDLVVEYGASLSLDPTTRREEIMQMMPMFEKAGIPINTLIGMLKLNELDGMYDLVDLPKLRQLEYFKEMTETRKYMPPREMEDHQGMLKTCYKYLMTSEFKYLPDDVQVLIEEHVKDREKLAAAGLGSKDPEAANEGENPPGPDAALGGEAPESPLAGGPALEGLDGGAGAVGDLLPL
jgi:hypothetical protein